MKVLQIVSNISIRNGIMSVLMNYYRNIDHQKIKFVFLYFDERPQTYQEEIESLGGEVYKLQANRNFFGLISEIRKYVKQNEKELSIIHIHEIYLIWSLIFINKKIPIIAHAHATKFSSNILKNVRNRILSLGKTKIANYYFACSKPAGNYIFGKKFMKKGYILNNAIDVEKFNYNKEIEKKLREEKNIKDKFVIGHVGNFNSQKNHEFLIDIFYELQKEKENAVMILVGDGENKEKIKEKCKNYGITNKVLFVGARDDVYRIIQMFDVFILPSKYEGLGIVLVEAQTAGIPCVFTDVVPEEANIIKEKNIQLSLNDDAKIWAKKIIELQGTKKKDNLKQITASGFNIKIEANKLEKQYEKIVDSFLSN